MLVQGNFVDYLGSRLHYAKGGHGPRKLIAFHGFGQDHGVFEQWVKPLEKEYSLYAFDLYFHGQSTWPGKRPLEKSDWKSILISFLQQETIGFFEIAGFSLGGKFALATLEAFPDRVKKVILIAPDGVSTNFWNRLATYPFVLRSLFKSMVLKPGRFYALARLFRSAGLVNPGIVRFAESQMDTEEKRKRVYDSWVYFRPFKFNMNIIAATFNEHGIPLMMVVGQFDKVIPLEDMDLLLKHLDQKQLEVLEAGHNDLINKTAPFLAYISV